ncbi:MAG TPA: DUF5703 family protein [Kineosporiaceae bacterium]|nr:DUF5703 family protein [Kineosporiaceae bacterium]
MSTLPLPAPGPLPQPQGAGGDYEYRVLVIPRGTSPAEARRLLTEHAEYGHWELDRVRVYAGGARQVWVRRKIIRARRTA